MTMKLNDYIPTVRNEMIGLHKRLRNISMMLLSIENDKNNTMEQLKTFVKTTDGKEILLLRDNDKSRIVINDRGMQRIRFRHHYGDNSVDITDILAFLNKNENDFYRAIKKDETLQQRVKCFVNAVKHLTELSKAWQGYKDVKDCINIKMSKKVIPIAIDNDGKLMVGNNEEEETTIDDDDEDGHGHDGWNITEVVLGSPDSIHIKKDDGQSYDNDKVLAVYNLNDWYVIEQFLDDINPDIDKAVELLLAVRKDMDNALTMINDKLAPVLTLEAL